MRDDEDPGPVVHSIRSDALIQKEARMGLDQLLARGQAIISRDARARAAKATDDELEIVRQRRLQQAAALAERFQWRPVAALAMFEEQTCRNCGSIHSMFRGFGTLYRRRVDNTENWKAADCLDRGLPFELRKFGQNVDVCADCIVEFAAPDELKPHEFRSDRVGD